MRVTQNQRVAGTVIAIASAAIVLFAAVRSPGGRGGGVLEDALTPLIGQCRFLWLPIGSRWLAAMGDLQSRIRALTSSER